MLGAWKNELQQHVRDLAKELDEKRHQLECVELQLGILATVANEYREGATERALLMEQLEKR